MNVTFRPISTWPGTTTPAGQRKSRYQFKASYADTLMLLDQELRHLGAHHVVIELALDEADIRLDGMPRAHANPHHPGVVVSFDSEYGPLRYATDAFELWQHNLRAIALGLEALRKVDRYGITRKGEQYTGWRQIEATSSETRGEELIREHGSVAAALKATHPDHGGDPNDLQAVIVARDMLGAS